MRGHHKKIAALIGALVLAACAAPLDWDNLPASVTGDFEQDAGIATNMARSTIREAEAMPLLQQLSCGPFRVDIRTPRTAPGPNSPTPHLGLVIRESAGFEGRVRFTRDTRPFTDTRIRYQTGSGWQDVTSYATALSLGAFPVTVIEPEPGSEPFEIARHVDLYLGDDPARNSALVLDGKYALTEIWSAFPAAGESAAAGPRARPGNYLIETGAEYRLAWDGGECGFSLPALQWRVPG